MKGPGAAQPRNNAPFHSLSDTYTWSYMNDPPRLPQDLIWSASPLSPASAPTDVFIIALSRLCRRRRRAGRGARRHLAGESRGSPTRCDRARGWRRCLPLAGSGGFRGEAAGLGVSGEGTDPRSRWEGADNSRHDNSTEELLDTGGPTTPSTSHPEMFPEDPPTTTGRWVGTKEGVTAHAKPGVP